MARALNLAPFASDVVHRLAFRAESRAEVDRLYSELKEGELGWSVASLSPDGRRLAFVGRAEGGRDQLYLRELATGLFRVSASGGEPRRFTNEFLSWPAFLPGGKSVLVAHRDGIAVVSLETGESKRVVELGNTPRYLSGYLLYWYEQSLYAAPFDLEKLAAGPGVPVVESVRKMFSGPALYAVSEDGSLVYLPGGKSSTAERSLVWVGRDGSFETVSETRRAFRVPRLSPDGNRIALGISEGPMVGTCGFTMSLGIPYGD